MKFIRVFLLIVFSLVLLSKNLVSEQGNRIYINEFTMRAASVVKESGAEISSPDFVTHDWYRCSVPTTVLNCLVEDGVYPEPYIGINNMKIPDSCDSFNTGYGLLKYSYLPEKANPWRVPYWFRGEFFIQEKTSFYRLVFNGINYRADVWINSTKIASADEMVGMFKRFEFNITSYVRKGKNVIAVKIYPLDFPGTIFGPYRRNENGGATGDIGKNVTMQCSVGWDWVPPVRDRNMGIWQGVYIEKSGPVIIENPRIITDLPLPETSPARLTISAVVKNLSRKRIEGFLNAFIEKDIKLKKHITLPPEGKVRVVFSPEDYPSLVIKNPRLWWPSGYGKVELYTLHLGFKIKGKISHYRRVNFGIREISTRLVRVNEWARRDFYINGKRIFIKGGAWVPDMMLRRGPERIWEELKLIKDANLNLVRIWGGGITPADEFFDYCDRLGLLVWHDFWITGDCQATWGKGSKDWPLESDVFLKNAKDVVLRLRNHPSLMVWTGGNEGYPGRKIYLPLRNEIIAKLDGTRPFLPSSGYSMPPSEWGLSLPDNKPSGVYSGGPYGWQEVEFYYKKVKDGKDWLFKDEVGVPSMPAMESIRRFITDFTPDPTVPVPFFNKQWRYHFAQYDSNGIERYGVPDSIHDFIRKLQLMAVERYRAIFEAVNSEIGRTSGVMLWKLNPAWPELRWQIYDYYLKPIPAYYYIKKACEPLHIQFSPEDLSVGIVNALHRKFKGLTAEVSVFSKEGKMIFKKKAIVEVPGFSYTRVFDLKERLKNGFYFIKLTLTDSKGKEISENFYWFSRNKDYRELNDLDYVRLQITVKMLGDRINIKLRNPSNRTAFFIELSLKDNNGEEILPVFWSDNYFSLLPGGERDIKAISHRKVKGNQFLEVKGWNISPMRVLLRGKGFLR